MGGSKNKNKRFGGFKQMAENKGRRPIKGNQCGGATKDAVIERQDGIIFLCHPKLLYDTMKSGILKMNKQTYQGKKIVKVNALTNIFLYDTREAVLYALWVANQSGTSKRKHNELEIRRVETYGHLCWDHYKDILEYKAHTEFFYQELGEGQVQNLLRQFEAFR